MSSEVTKLVQSCITTLTFPETIDELKAVFHKHDDLMTDIDLILNENKNEVYGWSAAQWMSTNDILFFYFGKTARQKFLRVKNEASKLRKKTYLKYLLEREEVFEQLYGSIFACSLVTDSDSLLSDDDYDNYTFESRFFAPVTKITRFTKPLYKSSFSTYIQISPGGTITPLDQFSLNELKYALAQNNNIPDYLNSAEFNNQGLKSINKQNWIKIIKSPTTLFVRVQQLRKYFTDYIVKALKDSDIRLCNNCQFYDDNGYSGFADYVIQVNGKWVSVIVRLALNKNLDILEEQIKDLTNQHYFLDPKSKEQFIELAKKDSRVIVIIDSKGIYIVKDTAFVDCSIDSPRWQREDLSLQLISEIRSTLIYLVQSEDNSV